MAPGVQVETVRRGLAEKAEVAIRIHGEFESIPQNRYVLRALSRLLEMRLREVLREEKGGTYSVNVSPYMQHHPVQTYGVDINFSCEPARVQELTDATWRIVRLLKAGPVAASYAQKISAQQAREDEVNKRNNQYWEGVLVSNLRRGETSADLLKYWSLHKTLSPTILHDAAQRFLDLERYVQVTLLPAKDAQSPPTP
jgi:zinc protease